MDKSIVWYLAGPMSNVPQFNFPAFDFAANRLRGYGYKIVSPAELDDPEVRRRTMASLDGKPTDKGGESWGDFLSRDVKLIADKVGGIIVMPGWVRSRGAKLEVFVGLLTDKKFGIWNALKATVQPAHLQYMRIMLQEFMP
jgi:hypothetical protein